MAQQDQANEASAPKKSRKKLLTVVLLLLATAGGAGFWYFNQAAATPAQAKQEPPKPPVFVSLETFTVNLQPDPAEQFLQVDLTLQLSDEEQAKIVQQHMPEVRNRLLMLLTSKKGSQLITIEGKQQLSREISAQLEQPFTAGVTLEQAPGVFFTSFVIQ
jgi:flagellar FliL protein